MKKYFSNVIFIALILPFVFPTFAQTSSDQNLVSDLIKRMYAVSPKTFEFAEFNNKYQPEMHCKFLSQFLAAEALVKEKYKKCATGVNNYFRYPSSDQEDLSEEFSPLPKVKLGTPTVINNYAEIKVLFSRPYNGRVLYFLKKQNEEWRIYKIRTDTHADIDENEKNQEKRKLIDFSYFPEKAVSYNYSTMQEKKN
jgi:hypothetical protein